jgi:hypothetical protein
VPQARSRRLIRLTDEALRAHPEGRNFGDEVDHPPVRGRLAVPFIGPDGDNSGFIQAFDQAHMIRDVAEPVPLADVAAAHRRIESGRSSGKMVLAVKP